MHGPWVREHPGGDNQPASRNANMINMSGKNVTRCIFSGKTIEYTIGLWFCNLSCMFFVLNMYICDCICTFILSYISVHTFII